MAEGVGCIKGIRPRVVYGMAEIRAGICVCRPRSKQVSCRGLTHCRQREAWRATDSSFTGSPDGDKRGIAEVSEPPSVGPVRSSPSVLSTPPKSSTVNCLIAPGLPAVKRWLLESILANECIDLTELPPAKGRSKVMPNSLEGKILLLHETDFQQTKQLIPDINTWIQCFSVYTAIVVHYFPERATSMLMYTASMGKLSQKFRWPSWVIYDQAYRQEAAESGKVDWSQVDASIHAQCFSQKYGRLVLQLPLPGPHL